MNGKRPRPGTGGVAGIDLLLSNSTPQPLPDPPAPPPQGTPSRLRLEEIRAKLTWDQSDLSALTGMSPRWIQRALAAGNLPPYDIRCGRRRFWRPATILRWLEQGGSR
jgi:hypothetical protein